MGGGAGKGNQLPVEDQNKLFLDEGMGYEASQLSRKWTKKISMFKDQETLRNDSPRSVKFSRLYNRRKNDDSSESIIYSSNEELSDKSESPQFKQFNRKNYDESNPIIRLNRKEDSDIEASSDEDQRKRTFSQQFNWGKQSENNDSEQEDDDIGRKLKRQLEQIQKALDEDNLKSIDSDKDLQIIEQIDLEQIFKQQQIQKQPQSMLKRLYMRSRVGNDKSIVGQEKKIKFDAKQEEFYDIFEEQDEQLSDSMDQEEGEKQQKQKDYTPQDFLEDIGIAITSKKGNKRDGPHMDDFFIYNDQYSKVIALLNGHGEYGHYISNICYRLLFSNLVRDSNFYTNPKRSLQKMLFKLQNQVKSHFDKKKGFEQQNCILSGCVITVIIQREQKLIVGHIGDNKSTIYKELQNISKQKKIVVELTPIHCPLDAAEKARIFNSGGEVRKNQTMDESVYARGRLYPQLHITRSIGDLIGHVIGVTSVPFIKEYDITPFDTFLVLSTSPTFIYMEQEEIMNHLTGFTLKNIRQACESLYKRAKSSWIVSEGVFDDMTIIMLWLGNFKDKK